ncbi:hypothetical protein HDV06_000275 [Boothiomyces sp. JEL0866]|nr:hypothetical protein HDV06_000275 [Boothiomyces sp. JEL0866]
MHLTIPSSGSVTLESVFVLGTALKNICVVISHPYGPVQSDLTVHKYFNDKGASTLRFNFRGVGQSTGRTSWQGAGETEDVVSVVNFINKYYQDNNLGKVEILLVGYSFGSICTIAAANQLSIKGLVSISYPYQVLWAITFFNSAHFQSQAQGLPQIPKLFIIGDTDNFTSISSWNNFVKDIPEPKNTSVIPGADHFWGRNTNELIRIIDQWAVTVL